MCHDIKNLVINNPLKTASNPTVKLPMLYHANEANSARCKSKIFSYAKEEKVVNPPQKPVVRKMRHSGESQPNWSANP
jgi:hypothetical protein